MSASESKIETKPFGILSNGDEVSLFILKAGDFCATFTNWGATWTSFVLPDKKGQSDDILLGFSTLSGYVGKHPFLGSTVGRFANRIGKARFAMDGKEYRLWANNGQNHLHGGRRGFDKYLWKYELSAFKGSPAIQFSRASPDGEEGYPGTLSVELTVNLSESGSLKLRYLAKTDAKTPVNLTNHAYFNLAGEGKGTILDHELQMHASSYLPVDRELIPTGKEAPVQGTALDFRRTKVIGEDIAQANGGYDFCYIIDKEFLPLKPFATVREAHTGRCMTVATTLPAVQFYTGNNLAGIAGKRGSTYDKYAGLCLETEMYPDSPNRPNFPSPFLMPGETWEHETIYSFSINK
jgi:aldose 1-epimerase